MDVQLYPHDDSLCDLPAHGEGLTGKEDIRFYCVAYPSACNRRRPSMAIPVKQKR